MPLLVTFGFHINLEGWSEDNMPFQVFLTLLTMSKCNCTYCDINTQSNFLLSLKAGDLKSLLLKMLEHFYKIMSCHVFSDNLYMLIFLRHIWMCENAQPIFFVSSLSVGRYVCKFLITIKRSTILCNRMFSEDDHR